MLLIEIQGPKAVNVNSSRKSEEEKISWALVGLVINLLDKCV